MTALALAISPHLDDAAFSCGGTLATLAGAGWRVVVATVFTASMPDPQGFALACQLDKGLPATIDYMALRRAEDVAAAEALGAEPVWLPFAEAPHRGYDSAAALFGPVRDDDEIVGSVSAALAALVASYHPALILAPQGIGGHVDHIQVVRALDAAGWAGPVLWWRDFPYAVRDGLRPEPFGTRMSALPEASVAVGAPSARQKEDACRAYASQLGFQFGGPDGLRRKLAETGGTELFRAQGQLPDGFQSTPG